jgi:hypothetical protein
MSDIDNIVVRLLHCSENCGDEYLHELTGKAADTITRLTSEMKRLTGERDRQYDYNAGQIVKQAALEAENETLRAALQGVLWMAEEWFKHDGSDATFDDDYKQELDAARAALEET